MATGSAESSSSFRDPMRITHTRVVATAVVFLLACALAFSGWNHTWGVPRPTRQWASYARAPHEAPSSDSSSNDAERRLAQVERMYGISHHRSWISYVRSLGSEVRALILLSQFLQPGAAHICVRANKYLPPLRLSCPKIPLSIHPSDFETGQCKLL